MKPNGIENDLLCFAEGLTCKALSFQVLAAVLLMAIVSWGTAAQDQDDVAEGKAQTVKLNLPPNTQLSVLIEYVSDRLKINVLYDQKIASDQITLVTPTEVPTDSLLGLLESVLRMKKLTLIDGEQPGWKRIVAADDVAAAEIDPDNEGEGGVSKIETRVFKIKYASMEKIVEIVSPLLTSPGGNSRALPENRVLIVTDYAIQMYRIGKVIDLVDQEGPRQVVSYSPIEHMPANDLAPRVQLLYKAKTQREQGDLSNALLIEPDSRSNQLILIGTQESIDAAKEIVSALDVEVKRQTVVYSLKEIPPQRIDTLVRELIGPDRVDQVYRSTIDAEAGLLVVTATDDAHGQVESLREALDIPVDEQQSPIRFYTLRNAKAEDVLGTLENLIDPGLTSGLLVAPDVTERRPNQEHSALLNEGPGIEGVNQGGVTRVDAGPGSQAPNSGVTIESVRSALDTNGNTPVRLSADVATNSIIVVAEPALQQVYSKLIEMLDRRRPQVLVEVIVMTLDTTDGFSLGVELLGNTSVDGTKRIVNFSSFGLSEVTTDPAGEVTVNVLPGLGLNSAMLNISDFGYVLRALKTSGRASVMSAPRLLVNDHATGVIESINEAPFTSVNSGETVSTTSFGGFVSAGTSVSMTPHISEDDYLQLEYNITLNSFTGEGAGGIPPPRQTNTIQSEVTVPDGSTIIVGGLNRQDRNNSDQTIPFLGEIPFLRHLVSNQTDNGSASTLFVFIRPVILRDDEFADLRHLSQIETNSAGLPSEFPSSMPMLIQ